MKYEIKHNYLLFIGSRASSIHLQLIVAFILYSHYLIHNSYFLLLFLPAEWAGLSLDQKAIRIWSNIS